MTRAKPNIDVLNLKSYYKFKKDVKFYKEMKLLSLSLQTDTKGQVTFTSVNKNMVLEKMISLCVKDLKELKRQNQKY